MKLGIFGGSFDPVHTAHLVAAEHIAEAYDLDKLLFIPAALPPHKLDRKLASNEHRLEMLMLATANNPRFEVSSLELNREGPSYTIDTVLELKRNWPSARLYLFIGLDNLAIFHSWKDADELKRLTMVVALARPTHRVAELPASASRDVEICTIPLLEISSTDIRERIHSGRSVRYLVPDSVRAFMKAQHLYAD